MSLARVRKAAVAALAFAAVIAAELPPGSPDWLRRWAPVVLAVAGVAGVYRVPNRQPSTPAPSTPPGPQRPSRVADDHPPPR